MNSYGCPTYHQILQNPSIVCLDLSITKDNLELLKSDNKNIRAVHIKEMLIAIILQPGVSMSDVPLLLELPVYNPPQILRTD